ncbi:MAG: OmpA family protein, partial [Clostridia bacterium]|nr:OmpA family protein [Clostridia bacterium]
MARQRVHNRRAGRGSAGGGASWISYSDMMAALLLVFVLILCVSLWQYFTMLESKTTELNEKEALLAVQQATLDEQSATMATQQTTLDEQAATLAAQQTTLDEQAATLAAQQTALDEALAALATRETELTALQTALDEQAAALAAQQTTLDEQALVLSAQSEALNNANTSIADKEAELLLLQSQLATQQAALDSAQTLLDEQQAAMQAQAVKIDALVGVRSQIITDLSNALSAASLRAYVDPTTGDITLDSAVFFKTNSDEIKEEGRALLDRFVPVYLSVLLRPEYRDFLGEIIIEGHTDTAGEYMHNLELSQNRALSVAMYVL